MTTTSSVPVSVLALRSLLAKPGLRVSPARRSVRAKAAVVNLLRSQQRSRRARSADPSPRKCPTLPPPTTIAFTHSPAHSRPTTIRTYDFQTFASFATFLATP